MQETSFKTYVRAFNATTSVSEEVGNYKNTTAAKIAKYTLMVLTCGIGYGIVKLLESHYNIKPKIHEFCANAKVIFYALDPSIIGSNKIITVSLPGNVSITLEQLDGNEILRGCGVQLTIGGQKSLCENQTFESIRGKILQDSIDNPGLYGCQFLGVEERIKEQEKLAYCKLTDKNAAVWVNGLANKIVDYLLKHLSGNVSAQNYFVSDCIYNFNNIKGRYPVPRVVNSIKTFEDLLNILRSDQPPAVKIGLMSVAMFYEFSESDKTVVLDLIKLFEKEKSVKPISGKIVRHNGYNPRFGDGTSETVDIFSEQYFNLYCRRIDLVDFKNASNRAILIKNSRSGKVCISGSSGLATLFCLTLERLKILPSSEDGKTFIDIMSAFIVGSGMGSFDDAQSTFELYLKYDKNQLKMKHL